MEGFGFGLATFILSLVRVDGESVFLGGLTFLNFVGTRPISVLDSLGMDRIARLVGFLDVIFLPSTDLLVCAFGLVATNAVL